MRKSILCLFVLGAWIIPACWGEPQSSVGDTPALKAPKGAFLDSLTNLSILASTVPRNGDVNPYGVAIVPRTMGALVAGSVLVSNFNDRRNLQGTGTTIVQVSPAGRTTLFASIAANKLPGACPGGVGLTTALVALRSGWVVVGSLPTKDGTASTAQAGCLIVLDAFGNVVETISGEPINGPWDMTALDGDSSATLFVTNVLDGTVAASPNVVQQGTVVRITLGVSQNPPSLLEETVVASGFPQRTDPAALVIGATGLTLSNGTLFVADTLVSRIAAIADPLTRTQSAGTGTTLTQGGALNSPLGLATAPNGDLISANGGDGNLVETTQKGAQVAIKGVDLTGGGAGDLFGLAVFSSGIYFVNDGDNTLDLLK